MGEIEVCCFLLDFFDASYERSSLYLYFFELERACLYCLVELLLSGFGYIRFIGFVIFLFHCSGTSGQPLLILDVMCV